MEYVESFEWLLGMYCNAEEIKQNGYSIKIFSSINISKLLNRSLLKADCSIKMEATIKELNNLKF